MQHFPRSISKVNLRHVQAPREPHGGLVKHLIAQSGHPIAQLQRC